MFGSDDAEDKSTSWLIGSGDAGDKSTSWLIGSGDAGDKSTSWFFKVLKLPSYYLDG